jgi:hypothetical protein
MSISNQVIGVLKGNWSLRRRQRLPLRKLILRPRSGQLSIFGGESLSTKQKDSVFGIIFTHLFMTKGGESNFKGSNDSVFGDSCQRGREHEPKAKGPHHHQFFFWFSIGTNFRKSFSNGMIFKLVSQCVQKGERVVSSKSTS